MGKCSRLAGGVHTNRIQYAILFFVFTVGLYLGLTWFFFGSPHPCGILEARQKPYALAAARKTWLEIFKTFGEIRLYLEDREVMNQYIEHLDTRDKQLDTALVDLKRRIWRLTPAECTWQAITWKAPQK